MSIVYQVKHGEQPIWNKCIKLYGDVCVHMLICHLSVWCQNQEITRPSTSKHCWIIKRRTFVVNTSSAILLQR